MSNALTAVSVIVYFAFSVIVVNSVVYYMMRKLLVSVTKADCKRVAALSYALIHVILFVFWGKTSCTGLVYVIQLLIMFWFLYVVSLFIFSKVLGWTKRAG